jgi:hypothetical protein
MREFSQAEQDIIKKILTIPEVQFKQLFTNSFLKNSRVEIKKEGAIVIFADDKEQWRSSILELNTVVNLLAYLLNTRLVFAYSVGVVIPTHGATLGDYKGKANETITLPYNKAILSRVTIRHHENLFKAYEPLRILALNNFVLKEDKRHRQIYWATLFAVIVALLAAVGPPIYDRFLKTDETKLLQDKYDNLDYRIRVVEAQQKILTTTKNK